MKLPKAKKLPSGSWNIQVQVDGKRVSITADTEKECVAKAAAFKAGMAEKNKSPDKLTVGEAVDRYIESKDSVLSPSTVAGYKRVRKHLMKDIEAVPLRLLTQEKVQRWVNALAKEKTPKTVRNAHGLLSATLSMYAPDMFLRTTLPQKRKYDAKIPELDELRKVLKAAEGTKVELPILLAVWMGLRVSEIRGLTWDSIEGDFLHIKQAIVDCDGGSTLKGTKSYSGDRFIRIPEYIKTVIENTPKTSEYIVPMQRQRIMEQFSYLCEKNGVAHYRFHDLRHTAASVAMSVGVPNTYNQQRMGHKTDNMLKTVYLHTLKSKEDEFANAIDSVFTNLLDPQNADENANESQKSE